MSKKSIEPIVAADPESKSADLIAANIAKLKELFPEVVAEGKVDFAALQEILGNEVETGEEFYRFTWAGKAQAKREAHKPSTGTLRPCPEESVEWEKTKNLYIEGDNLEVLKLLQKSYGGQVKMIYIDPPYNTGKDFVYKDNYRDNLRNYKEQTAQVDSQGNTLSTNSDTDGRYHSNWLNMMYPRLRLARNILKDNGLIAISLDEHEIDSLKKIVSEVFGNDNFIITTAVNRTSEIASNNTVSKHEYILFAAKNIGLFEVDGVPKITQSRGTVGNVDQTQPEITFPAGLRCVGIPDGKYSQSRQISGSMENIQVLTEFEVRDSKLAKPVTLKARWRSSNDMRNFFDNDCKRTKAKINGFVDDIFIEGDRFMPQIVKSTFEKIPSLYTDNSRGSIDIEELGLGGVLEHPKAVSLLTYFISLFSLKNEIVLDFFSGSGTTAHAVMRLNAEDGGQRQHIQVQLPEPTDAKSEAYKAGYKTIAEIGKERIRRAGKKIVGELEASIKALEAKAVRTEEEEEELKEKQVRLAKLDIGFRVFKLDSSNINAWDGDPERMQENLLSAAENIKPDRTEADVLYEVLLKYGLNLTLPIEERTIAKRKVYNVGRGALFLCLAEQITNAVAEGIGQWKEELKPETCRVIFRDNGFTDVEKTNAMQALKRFGVTEVRSV